MNLTIAQQMARTRDPLAIVAHELRNPIGAIRNAVRVVETLHDLPGTVEEACRLIARQVGQLSVLVEDLLDFSSASRGTLSLYRRSIDVVEEVNAAIEACAWIVARCHHRLVTRLPQPPLYAYVDGPRLRQVVTNLLDNACKYTPPHGRIAIRLYRSDTDVVVRVEDNGPGIASERLPYVFDLFTRACLDREGAPRGLGVGLALVREIVTLHGGRVEARSDGLGCGSVFIVRLPVDALATADDPATAARD